MTDYQLQAPTRRCHLTGRELQPGEKYVSALLDEAGRFVRRDFAPDAWVGPPENSIGHWAARVPKDGQAPKQPPIDDDMLAECFHRLDGATDPDRVQFRYVVALLLMRRKRFKFEDVTKDAGGETLLLRDIRTGDRHAVADPGLTEDAMAAVQDEVFRVLGVGLTMKQAAGSGQRAVGSKRWFCCVPPSVCCVLAIGCMGLSSTRPLPPPPAGPLYTTVPTTKEIVDYLNRSTGKIASLESREVAMDIRGDQSVGVQGTLYCEKPRNFRLRAKKPVLGTDAADFGSNEQEFWYWISENKPPDLFHCSYADLSRGNVQLPFPFHPDWMLEALGVAAPAPVGTPEQEQARGRTLEVRQSPDKTLIYLYERTTSIQGQAVTKLTSMANREVHGTAPQIVGHYLYDTRSEKLICEALVSKVQYDAASGAIVPQKIEIHWPAMRLTLAMTLSDVAVNDPKLASNTKLFARPHRSDVHETDLARVAPLMTPTGVQRAGAFR